MSAYHPSGLFLFSSVFNFLFALILFLPVSGIGGEIRTDGSLGPAVSLEGPAFTIGPELGEQRGGNLFHSFTAFWVDSGESAVFKGPQSVETIIGRVTGGQQSRIDGLVRSEIPGADLFLLNPWGVVFGPNASLDVSGSFHVSTADYLCLGSEGRFEATHPEAGVLSAAPPSAFGFLSDHPSGIEITGGFLEVPEGRTLSVIGGDVRLHNATLLAPGGRIDLVSASGPGEVRTVPGGLEVTAEASGNITVFRDIYFSLYGEDEYCGDIDVSGMEEGLTGGEIYIRGGRLEILGGYIAADNRGEGRSGGIDIQVSGDVIVDTTAVDDGGWIQSASHGTGDAGDVIVRAENLRVLNGGGLSTGTTGSGKGGNLDIRAESSVIVSGKKGDEAGGLFANTFEGGGQGGNILISASELRMADEGTIEAVTTGDGDAGRIEIDAGEMILKDGAQILTDTRGHGRGGNITITGESLSLSSEDPEVLTAVYADTLDGDGQGGAIDITVSSLEVGETGRITARTYGDGNAGEVTIRTQTLIMSADGRISGSTDGAGNSGNITLSASGEMTLSGDSWIVVDTDGDGGAGNISITAGELRLEDTAWITGDVDGNGNGGSIEISAGRMSMSDGSLISTKTKGEGDAGSIHLDVADMAMTGGAKVETGASWSGNGGAIVIRATGAVRISGRDEEGNNTSLFANTDGTGRGGSIIISAADLRVADSALIRAETRGGGQGGEIDIAVDRMTLTDGAQVSGSTWGSGSGGGITVQATDSLLIAGLDEAGYSAGFFAATYEGGGRGGVIRLSSPELLIRDDGVVVVRSTASGQAGEIRMEGDTICLDEGAFVSAIAESSGGGGEIRLTGASLWISDGAVILADTWGSGSGGDIFLSVSDLTMSGRARISAMSSGSGTGGRITFNGDAIRMTDSDITTETDQSDGGNMAFQISEFICLADSGITTSVQGGAGNGGNITVAHPVFVVLDNGWIIANAYGGNGGNIAIATDYFIPGNSGKVEASSALGVAGQINIQAPDTDISGAVTALPDSFFDGSMVLMDPCETRTAEEKSSLIAGGLWGTHTASDDIFTGFSGMME